MTSCFVLGLTGRMGSGKSTVAKHLEQKGFVWIDVDQMGHQAYVPSSVLSKHIQHHFGTLDRTQIRDRVFHHPKERRILNSLLHPFMRTEIKKQLMQKPPRVVIDAALLFEMNLHEFCDRVWAVWSTTSTVSERLHAKGWDLPLIERVLRTQKTQRFFKTHADVLIENNHSKPHLYHTLDLLLKNIS